MSPQECHRRASSVDSEIGCWDGMGVGRALGMFSLVLTFLRRWAAGAGSAVSCGFTAAVEIAAILGRASLRLVTGFCVSREM